MSAFLRSLRWVVGPVVAVCMAACGGGSGGSPSAPPVSAAAAYRTPLLIRDAPSENWASVAVKVLSITLAASDGSTVVVYQPSTPAPMNLAQLDQIAEQLGSAIPAGTYTGATITLAANPGDVVLTVGADPESGFVGAPGSVIPANQTVITGAQGVSGALTVAIPIQFKRSVTVTATQSTPIEFDFDLGHPAFVITHAVTGGATIYTVTFKGGVVFPHPVTRVTDLVLRHLYGSAASVSTDNKSVTIGRELPTLPITSPETAVSLGLSTTVWVDGAHGTLYYDLDTSTTPTTLTDFSSVAGGIVGKQLRIEARYQPDGSLVATRVFAAGSFVTVWRSPEGHVLRVDAAHNAFTVTGEDGSPTVLSVDDSTQFIVPNQAADAAPIGTGSAFLSQLHRGFKVHVTTDVANSSLARLVEIEAAAFSGRIANATASQFDVMADFRHQADGYAVTLPYVATSTVTDVIAGLNPVSGFSYWNFAYPTQVIYSQPATSTTAAVDAVTQFLLATNGSVGFGGMWGPLYARGETQAIWGDPNNPTGWSAPWVELRPTRVPTAWVSTTVSGNEFGISAPGGAVPLTVTFDTTPGSATLVYEVQRTHDAISLTAPDISTALGLSTMTSALALNTPVRISGIPQADGTLKAYAITYFTGTHPTN
jgi:Domain of unknown function (DUF4382)/Domain of unknown function (DUF5666)